MSQITQIDLGIEGTMMKEKGEDGTKQAKNG